VSRVCPARRLTSSVDDANKATSCPLKVSGSHFVEARRTHPMATWLFTQVRFVVEFPSARYDFPDMLTWIWGFRCGIRRHRLRNGTNRLLIGSSTHLSKGVTSPCVSTTAWCQVFLKAVLSAISSQAEDVGNHRQYLEQLFRDLVYWSCVEQRAKLGRFELRRLGSLRFVGLIRGQLLLAPSDRATLERVFASQGFSPTRLPSRAELVRAAIEASAELRASVRRLLGGWPSDAISP